MTSATVHLYMRDADGTLFAFGDECEIEDLGGTVPRVGDSIVSRDVISGGEAYEYRARSILIVEAVYFRPDRSREHPGVQIVVRERAMDESERNLL